MRKVLLTFFMLLIGLSLIGCAGPSPDATAQPTDAESNQNGSTNDQQFSGEAPRTDTPIYPDAALVYEKKYPTAVEEMYATDAPVADVIGYYEKLSRFETIRDTMDSMDGAGAYFETPLMKMFKKGESVQGELADSGPLMYIMILPSDADQLGNIVGDPGISEELPAGKTIISLRILTDTDS